MLKELAETSTDTPDVLFVCDKAFERQSRGIMATLPFAVAVKTVVSGKLRRYAHFSWWHYLRHFSIVLHNLADTFKTLTGFIQSVWIIIRFRPDVVFAKGGYVCLPVGLAAKLCRIPLVIHDSDARPGLTNRVLARFAAAIGTGMPLEHYNYKKSITQYVGVPINPMIVPTTTALQAEYREELGLDAARKLVVAVGGGLGSVTINSAVIKAAKQVDEDVLFYNVTGAKNFDDAVRQAGNELSTYKPVSFVYSDMHKLLGAADIVVTRASATTLQELAGLEKTVIAVPAKQLGDQAKNAELFAKYGAVVVLQDDTLSQELPSVISRLLHNAKECRELAKNLHSFAKPGAARDMAAMIVREAKRR